MRDLRLECLSFCWLCYFLGSNWSLVIEEREARERWWSQSCLPHPVEHGCCSGWTCGFRMYVQHSVRTEWDCWVMWSRIPGCSQVVPAHVPGRCVSPRSSSSAALVTLRLSDGGHPGEWASVVLVCSPLLAPVGHLLVGTVYLEWCLFDSLACFEIIYLSFGLGGTRVYISWRVYPCQRYDWQLFSSIP